MTGPIKIGNILLPANVFLAPMAGVTDSAFRILCRRQGCGLVYSEMVSAKGMHYESRKSAEIAEILPEEQPAAVQIFGSDPAIMAETAASLETSDACLLDINMGCPTLKIVRNGDGCALMRDPVLAGKVISAVVRATSKPVTVKIRKGWSADQVNAVEIARIAEGEGAGAVTVHGRTRDQFYGGQSDPEIIREVREAVRIPVIGNGDIRGPEEARRLFDVTGCDAIMVGRGAMGNPWVFRSIREGRVYQPSAEEIRQVIREHADRLVEVRGESRAILEMRKHLAWYVRGYPGAAATRQAVFACRRRDELMAITNKWLESMRDGGLRHGNACGPVE